MAPRPVFKTPSRPQMYNLRRGRQQRPGHQPKLRRPLWRERILMESSRRKRLLLARLLPALITVAPAFAQVDFSGEWAPFYHEDAVERGPGAELGDYTELPINEAGRLQADSYDADRISVVEEYQCRPHSPDYGFRSLGNLRIWRDIDPRT